MHHRELFSQFTLSEKQFIASVRGSGLNEAKALLLAQVRDNFRDSEGLAQVCLNLYISFTQISSTKYVGSISDRLNSRFLDILAFVGVSIVK